MIAKLIESVDIKYLITLLFGSGILGGFIKYISGRLKENDDKTNAVCKGVQALLRSQLYDAYDKYTDRGYAPIYAKENFLNMYEQYHCLGANGVMDKYKETFMELPDKLKEETKP